MVSLLDAILGLLDTGGNPTGLGANLKGIYAQTWREIINAGSSGLLCKRGDLLTPKIGAHPLNDLLSRE
jgi:hypothetical protein